MKTASTALKTHLAGAYHTVATCWKCALLDGSVRGFTDHDRDLVVDGVTYRSAYGFVATDSESSDSLNMDNLEVQGGLTTPAISEDELRAGIWDYARVVVFLVNWADLTMGTLIERAGTLGQVSAERQFFRAELSGLMRAFKETIGELTSPTCRANLGDARCRIDLYALTVTGTVTGINDDGITFYDTSRSEQGPADAIPILQITATNPVTVGLTENISGFHDYIPIVIAGVSSFPAMNTVWRARRLNASSSQFSIPLDGTVIPGTINNEGTALPLSAAAGYFDHGVLTWLTGDNAGRSMEIRNYAEGQITLVLPMPYAIQVGDTYSLHPGCDKQLSTCIDRFDNVLNFRGEPYLPGNDKIVQVARRT